MQDQIGYLRTIEARPLAWDRRDPRGTLRSRVIRTSTTTPVERELDERLRFAECRENRGGPRRDSNTSPGRALRDLGRLIASCVILAILMTVTVHLAYADPLDDETRRIAKQLQCPVCAGAAVADSPSDLAGQMRSVIRAKLEAGESEEQIIAYFVERYGDGVLIEPPRRGIGLAVWLAPIAVFVAGALLLWRVLKLWLRQSPSHALSVTGSTVVDHPPTTPHRNGTSYVDEPAPVTAVDRARAELDRFRAEG